MTLQSIETIGLADIQRRIARLGDRLKPGALRRPSVDVAKRLVASNRKRLGRGVDVYGRPLHSEMAKRLGLIPLGGEYGRFARSVHAEPMSGGDGVDLYSTFIGADVAYQGKTITPRNAKYLTIPLEAKGGEFSQSDSGGFLSAGLSIKDNFTGRRARHYDNTFTLQTDGKLFIVQNDKRKKFNGNNEKKLRFLFLLVRSTRYPKNVWLGAAREDQEMAATVYGAFIDQTFIE
ncbi:MAG TPA: hypothetical protein VFN10_22635 [Thermoanaerobaculia bacterium]|nr:hypothetical protein [Thermoanaerobaculia bacterium]